MDVSQRMEKFNEECGPFYICEPYEKDYSLCMSIGYAHQNYNGFCQRAFNEYARRTGRQIYDGRFYAHGDGHEWAVVFKKAFNEEEGLKEIELDCEMGGFYCNSRNFDVLENFGRRFYKMCKDENLFTDLVIKALTENELRQDMSEKPDEINPFFVAVAVKAKEKGYKVSGLKDGKLILIMQGKYIAQIDETGKTEYKPCDCAKDISELVTDIKKSFAMTEGSEGMVMNM